MRKNRLLMIPFGILAFLTLGIAVVGLGMATPAHAAALGCGTTITRSITLTEDLGPCPGDGITIGADNVTFNLGGHTISGSSAHGNSSAGIRLQGRTRVTVTGGTVTGFDAGVAVLGGSRNVLTRLVIRDNIGSFTADFCDGVFIMNSADNLVSGSHISHNGPCEGVGIFGSASIGDEIQGNVIENQNLPRNPSDPTISTDFGINLGMGFDTWPSHVTVKGNVVRNNAGDGIVACSQFGNPCVSTDDLIEGNVVQRNGFYFGAQTVLRQDGGDGIRLSAVANTGQPSDFTVATRITVKNNIVTGNAAHGIFVSTQQNAIVGNHSVDNNQSHGFFLLDILDISSGQGADIPPCDSNVWSGNSWGRYFNALSFFGPVGLTNLGSYDPECVSANGVGPRPGAIHSFDLPRLAAASVALKTTPGLPRLAGPHRKVP